MASAFVSEDLSCPVCCDIPCDPVVLPCGHIICQPCLPESQTTEESPECPVCRNSDALSDSIYQNLYGSILPERHHQASAESDKICIQHNKELKFFCLTDEQLICLVCKTTRKHINHSVCSRDEATSRTKRVWVQLNLQNELSSGEKAQEELRDELEFWRGKLRVFEDAKQHYTHTSEYIKKQACRTEKRIQEEFQKLHASLRSEEVERKRFVKKEEEQKIQIIKESIEENSKEIAALSDIVRTIEAKLGAEDISSLQDLKATLTRLRSTPMEPKRVSGALIDVAKHLQNLSFEVLVNMQDIVQYTPVTLDPNTSHPSLLLSGDLTTITYQEEQLEKLPNNPERFQSRSMVLGSEGFISGTHCWDVEVGDNRAWAVGVITESAQRERASLSENQFWEVAFYTDMYEAQSLHEPLTALTLTTEPRRIRVELDYDNGILHFSDPVTKTALYTFKDTFTHRVFPYFQSDSCLHPLKIVPMKLSMRLKKHRLPAKVCASMNESLDESRSSEPLYENVELFKVKEAQ